MLGTPHGNKDQCRQAYRKSQCPPITPLVQAPFGSDPILCLRVAVREEQRGGGVFWKVLLCGQTLVRFDYGKLAVGHLSLPDIRNWILNIPYMGIAVNPYMDNLWK